MAEVGSIRGCGDCSVGNILADGLCLLGRKMKDRNAFLK